MASTTTPNLLTVAPELRNMVYREVAMSVDTVAVNTNSDNSHDNVSDAILVHHSLPKVCRQLRDEAGPVIEAIAPLTAPEIIIWMDAFHFEKLSKLSEHLEAQADHCQVDIPGPKSMHMVFKLGSKTLPSLKATYSQLAESLEPGSATASPFRYATLFKLVDLSCDFLLRTKDMATAEKRQTITREQIKQCLFLWDSLDDRSALTGWVTSSRTAIGTLCMAHTTRSSLHARLGAKRRRRRSGPCSQLMDLERRVARTQRENENDRSFELGVILAGGVV